MFSPVATASLLRKHWLTDRQKTVPQLPPPLNSPGPAKNDLGSQSSNNETAGVLRPNGRNYCQIFGSTPSGRISALAFSSTATVAALKTMVQKRDGVPRDEQILVFEGKMLDSGFILAAYGVQRNATIHVTLRLRGGSEQFNRHPSEGGAAARPVNISTALDSAESVTEVDELEDIYAGLDSGSEDSLDDIFFGLCDDGFELPELEEETKENLPTNDKSGLVETEFVLPEIDGESDGLSNQGEDRICPIPGAAIPAEPKTASLQSTSLLPHEDAIQSFQTVDAFSSTRIVGTNTSTAAINNPGSKGTSDTEIVLPIDFILPSAAFSKDYVRKTLEDCLSNKRNLTVVHVHGMNQGTTSKHFRQASEWFGELEKAKLQKWRKTRVNKGDGYLYFRTLDDAKSCVRGLYQIGYECSFSERFVITQP